MANYLKVNPATSGDSDATHLYRRATVLHDKYGNDIDANNPITTSNSFVYRKEIDTTDGTVIYVGVAALGSVTGDSVWQIKRVTINGALISTEWADGDTDFNNAWSGRTTLSYS